jgi:hypothetical protein
MDSSGPIEPDDVVELARALSKAESEPGSADETKAAEDLARWRKGLPDIPDGDMVSAKLCPIDTGVD